MIQSISQWQAKKQRNHNVSFMRSLNVPKNNVNCLVVTKAFIT